MTITKSQIEDCKIETKIRRFQNASHKRKRLDFKLLTKSEKIVRFTIIFIIFIKCLQNANTFVIIYLYEI